ncbi:ATP-binding cassette sub-family G member 1-like [Ischnura elegans]|uniref:ATP-binding cassette sub-family G member 1-like n=1 Tax=Ischnura elegans TaxID=197161 RepID=UPI001ED877DA|nr:ATP-binding cassette sub-family G member 1-like [Ischnura elegans]
MEGTSHQPVDLVFRDVGFVATQLTMKGIERRKILHDMNGEFGGGQLSAIMGPSGAGKSTLLKILAGYTCRGVQGEVSVMAGDMNVTRSGGGAGCCGGGRASRPQGVGVRRRSCLIRQEDHLREVLTVWEAMRYTARLKMGGRINSPCCHLPGSTPKERDEKVNNILEMLGLSECKYTRTNRLSGGQRKRLSIALELIDDPPIMFLDEPTTGLDSSSCTQCVSLLKRLAEDGRTIVCTIHQPSALLLDMFDHLYIVADGWCAYQGSVAGLLPFLSTTANLQCPQYHNPADYIMETLCSDENGKKAISSLSSAINNGEYSVTNTGTVSTKPIGKKKQIMRGDIIRKQNGVPSAHDGVVSIRDNGDTSKEISDDSECKKCDSFRMASTSFEQLCILSRRNMLIMRRNYSQLGVRLAAHLAIGVIFGYLYRNMGNEGSGVLANFVYVYGSLLFLVYTGKMAVLLSFPLEMEVLSQEHFNRWYSLVPYCFSTLMAEIPFQVMSCLSYLVISYVLTGQPLESTRLILFFLSNILASLAAQSCGYLIGATTPIKVAVFIGPVIAVLLSVFGFCITYRDTPKAFKWLFHVSYFRYAFHANMNILYGMDRGILPCNEKFYCHYRYPTKFLSELDIADPPVDVVSHLSFICTFAILVHCSTFMAIWLRLNHFR